MEEAGHSSIVLQRFDSNISKQEVERVDQVESVHHQLFQLRCQRAYCSFSKLKQTQHRNHLKLNELGRVGLEPVAQRPRKPH